MKIFLISIQLFLVSSVFGNDLLPSWNTGGASQKVLTFIESVTDSESNNYVSPEMRVACIDMDGTLLAEKPNYLHVTVAIARLNSKSQADPELLKNPVYAEAKKGALSRDLVWEGLAEAFAGERISAYHQYVRDFLNTKNPLLNLQYRNTVYQPMIELIDLLQRNEFRVYLVSTSQQEFLRAISDAAFGIPQERVIGTVLKYDIEESDADKYVFVRSSPSKNDSPYFEPLNANAGKVINIHRRGFPRPIIAIGNSGGDLEMLKYTDRNEGPRLVMVVDHDDKEREFFSARRRF